jgi:two-component system NtrC family sensor kinase
MGVPVAGIIDETEQLMKEPDLPAASQDHLKKIHNEVNRCKEIVQHLDAVASYNKAIFGDADINHVLEETVELLEMDFKNETIKIEKELSADLPHARADSNQIKQLLLSLFINAQQSFNGKITEGTEKAIHVRSSFAGGAIRVEVKDNGCGIEPENIDKIFTPFFTTKNPHEHIGLGLSISQAIIEQHQGSITVNSNPREGTTFSISLPVYQ